MTAVNIPRCIQNQDRVSEEYGEETLAFLAEMTLLGDPLAEQVAKSFTTSDSKTRYDLRFAISNGLDSLDEPHEAISNLLKDTEQLPAGTDLDLINQGSETYLSIGPEWLTISLGPGSLTHTYASPVIADLLMKTGNLKDQARRRLAETAFWSHQVARPNGLKVGAPGYVHSVQVRMLHAQIRSSMLKQGWDIEQQGMPINQLDLARTWLDFTCVPLNALNKLGIEFTPEEEVSLYALWRLVAHYMGISKKLYGPISNQAEAQKLLDLIDLTVGEPNQASVELTHVMLKMVADIVQPALGVAVDQSLHLMNGICRLFHGDKLADFLNLEKSSAPELLEMIIAKNQFKRQSMRVDPVIREKTIEKTLAAFDAMDSRVEGSTRYQANLTETEN